jgi:hypothetical protein
LALIWRPVIAGNDSARFAESFVMAILWMQMFGVLILTPAYIAGAIAEQREKNSLDLLLLGPSGKRAMKAIVARVHRKQQRACCKPKMEFLFRICKPAFEFRLSISC